jgi:hypothetical protein
VPRTELVDDRRPGGGLVADDTAAGTARELGEEAGVEAVRKYRKRPIQHDTHHLPMAGNRVLAGRGLRHAAGGGFEPRANGGRLCRTEPRDTIEAERAQRRQGERHRVGDVAERVAAVIAVGCGVGQLADADAVEHDHDGAGWRGHALLGRTVVGNRLRGANGGDRVLEDHIVGAGVIEDDRKSIEILDPAFELGAIHHPDRHGELLAAHVVQEDVLNVRLDNARF